MPGSCKRLYPDLSDSGAALRAGALEKVCQQGQAGFGRGFRERDSQDEETL